MVRGCRALASVIDSCTQQFDATTRDTNLYYDRPYEWRLNMRTGKVKEKNLTADTEFSMDFPTISETFSGLKNRFGYTQVVDPMSNTTSGDHI